MHEFVLPRHQVDQAAQWLAAPYPPAPERPASTVMLVRESREHPIEVYMVRRAPTMTHTPGVVAFPGGSIRPDDADVPVNLSRSLDSWAEVMGEPANSAQRLLVAAVREVFEETGVLLADSAQPLTSSTFREAREAIEMHNATFADFVAAHALNVTLDNVAYRGTWTTPDFLPRRYRVAFFTALVPSGQEPAIVTTEATVDRWAPPQEYLERAARGEIKLVAPTRFNLQELAGMSSLEEALTDCSRRFKYSPHPSSTSPTGYVLR
ncbi:NUDIX domain-containing protein [Arcanobacterium haemolyticum]|nr:NUDIX domain-containing protein [Arcanobacterium haemolyticum]